MQERLPRIASNGAPSNRSHSPRILILPVSTGTGHLRAAEALELALRQVAPQALVKNVDVLTLATKPFRSATGRPMWASSTRTRRCWPFLQPDGPHPADSIFVSRVAVNGMNVVNSYVGRDFMTALADRHAPRFFTFALALESPARPGRPLPQSGWSSRFPRAPAGWRTTT
jgi:hypothetical protein